MKTYQQYDPQTLFAPLFRYQRKYREDGKIFYEEIEPPVASTGITALDDFLTHVHQGERDVSGIAKRMEVKPEDLTGLVRLTLGLTPAEYIRAYEIYKIDQLLRYTDMKGQEIVTYLHLGTSANLSQRVQYHCKQTPMWQRSHLREEGDLGRYVLNIPEK